MGFKITARQREYYRYTGVSAELERLGLGSSRPELAWANRKTQLESNNAGSGLNDKSASPLEAVATLVEERTHGQLFDLSYRVDPSETRVSAWLIAPKAPVASSYVVFLHGGGQDRNAFIEEAYLFAGHGIASLLVDLPQARAFPQFAQPEEDLSTFHRTVVSVRHGVDFLVDHSEVDGYCGTIIGFSFGAWIGSIVAAADHRVKAAVLTAFVPRMSEFWRLNPHPDVARIRAGLAPETLARFATVTRPMDTLEHLRHRTDVRLLLQFGLGDEFVTEDEVREFLPYSAGNNLLRVYESGSHFQMFLDPVARRDRVAWLLNQLSS
jgi:cephalosporin-C deacetylase-like acetyl esterase